MDIVISILAIVAGIVGILGSILPGLPGTPISWVGLLLLYIWGNGTNAAGDPVSMKMLLVWGVVVAVVSVIDYFVPMYFTKLTGGSRHAERGAMVGLLPRYHFHTDRNDPRLLLRFHHRHRPEDHRLSHPDVEDNCLCFLGTS